MPLSTPFHERTQQACITYKWKDWAGYHAPCVYGLSPEREYNAIRHGSAMLDVTPLYKYDLTGPDAGAFLARIMVRDVSKMKTGRMTYLCWCDDNGHVLDDGTVAKLSDEHYRLTSAAPAYHWLSRHAVPFDVAIEDLSNKMAALALQGPTSRDLLRQVCDADMDALKFFGITKTRFASGEGWLSRTGYTGDLGYELWVPNEQAIALWDAVTSEGKSYGAHPAGLDALDISRVEAGFILRGVDYHGANEAHIDEQKSTPFELGLDWCVKLKNRDPFIGQAALEREKAEGSKWSLVGLEIDWVAIENMFNAIGLPPQVPSCSWRSMIPIFAEGRQIGRATSGTWSPTLKKNIALATIESEYKALGTAVHIEWTIEWERKTVPAFVAETPFFDPERKRK